MKQTEEDTRTATLTITQWEVILAAMRTIAKFSPVMQDMDSDDIAVTVRLLDTLYPFLRGHGGMMDERCDNYSLTSSQSFTDEEIIEALKRLAQQWQEISERSRAAATEE